MNPENPSSRPKIERSNGGEGLPFSSVAQLALLVLLWAVIYGAALFRPPLLDDADATHALAARSMLETGDWVTLHVHGVRYLEKPPLPYWLVAASFRLFGLNAFAAHLPGALAVLGLALLGYAWGRRVFGERAGLYAGLAALTCTGMFLFTRVFIPEAMLSLLLLAALYGFQRALEGGPRGYALGMWAALALAVLTKGLIALVFVAGAAFIFLWLTGGRGLWRRLMPGIGVLIFLAIAAPWHVLASLRNVGGAGGHGFAWFYFVNEHVLRFLGRRVPRDYNKLPPALYWSLHAVWLFPWSVFAPVAAMAGWRQRRSWRASGQSAAGRSVVLLGAFAAIVVLFFSFSTNQEYYTFPAYVPLLLLTAAGVCRAEQRFADDGGLRRALLWGHGVYAVLGLGAAGALAYGLWLARGFTGTTDIGNLMAHREVSHYTLSMASFFDLTGRSFSSLRLPAGLALGGFLVGPALAWLWRVQRKHVAASLAVAGSATVFLVAAHVALGRFAPMLSSKDFADRIETLERSGQMERGAKLFLLGDQAYGSSLVFYTGKPANLVDGKTTSMEFGSTFADAPRIFVTSGELSAEWGRGERKILFVPVEHRAEGDVLFGGRSVVLGETAGKLLLTDRPLVRPD